MRRRRSPSDAQAPGARIRTGRRDGQPRFSIAARSAPARRLSSGRSGNIQKRRGEAAAIASSSASTASGTASAATRGVEFVTYGDIPATLARRSKPSHAAAGRKGRSAAGFLALAHRKYAQPCGRDSMRSVRAHDWTRVERRRGERSLTSRSHAAARPCSQARSTVSPTRLGLVGRTGVSTFSNAWLMAPRAPAHGSPARPHASGHRERQAPSHVR